MRSCTSNVIGDSSLSVINTCKIMVGDAKVALSLQLQAASSVQILITRLCVKIIFSYAVLGKCCSCVK